MHARATIGFGFTSDWLKKWRENFEPITEWSNAKAKQVANYFRHSIENRSTTFYSIDIYLIDVCAVDTVSNHPERAFTALKSLHSGWIIEARHSRKARLETTEVLDLKKKTAKSKLTNFALDFSLRISLHADEERLRTKW